MGVVVLSLGTELHSHTTVGHCVTSPLPSTRGPTRLAHYGHLMR